MSIKRNIYIKISHSKILKPFLEASIKLNLLFFHWNERFQINHFGELNPDKKIFVIRPRGMTEGLLSIYYYCVELAKWCEDNGYIPYIDFDKYPSQYKVEREINRTNNAWEYYFCQPAVISPTDIYHSKNVFLSGWTFKKKERKTDGFKSSLDRKEYMNLKFGIQPYIWKLAEEKHNELFKSKQTVGVFLRGTDYVRLKPKGHHVQPSVDDVIKKIKEYLEKYPIDQIFVVTEDMDIFKSIKECFGDRVFSSDDKFIESKGTDYISDMFHDDFYERGLRYLIRLLLLTKCDYLISSLASGSQFALDIKQDDYKDSYIFDIGRY